MSISPIAGDDAHRRAGQHGRAAPHSGRRARALALRPPIEHRGAVHRTKEVIGGHAILEAPSMEEAIGLTERFLRVHGDEWDLECELRPLDGPEFGARA